MKILYTITKSEIGGAQIYLGHLLEFARQRGNNVTIMSYPGGWLEKKVKELGFEFVPNIYFKNSYSPVNLLRAIFFTRKKIKELDSDIVHANSGGAGFFTRLACIGLRPKVIFTAHGWSFTDGTPLFRKTIAKIGENIMTFFTDKIICVSGNDARLARKVLISGLRKIEVIHNGVSVGDKIANIEDQEKIKIIFVGRLARPKMPISILKAIKNLPDNMRNKFYLNIVGFGEQEVFLNNFIKENKLADNVVIKNSLKPEEVLGEYLSSNLFVLPTQWEGFPMVIVEAMSAGLPVIASNVGGIKEIVDDSVGKLMTRGNEEKELADLFKVIIENNDWITQRGKNARKRVEEKFTSEIMCSKTWKVYEQA